MHLILVAMGSMRYRYTPLELSFLISGMVIYAVPLIICAFGGFRKHWHKDLLLSAMIGAGAVIYAIIVEDGGAFILFPMFIAGLYYSESMCITTYIHLICIVLVDCPLFFALDINHLHYYGLFWSIPVLVFNYIVPELVYLTVVFVLSLLAMKNGKKLISNLVSSVRETEKNAELMTCAQVQKSALPGKFDIAPDGQFSIAGSYCPPARPPGTTTTSSFLTAG